VIQIFLDKGEDVDTTIEDETAFTPLMVAIKYGQVHTVEFLINQCNANIVNENGSGFSAIHIAAERNLPEIIRMIVAKGESVDRIMRGSHLTPLHLAVGTRSVSSLITLLALGANPFAKSLPFCGAKTALDTAKDMLQYGFKCVPKMIEILETAQTHPENLPVPLTATQIALCFDMIQQGLTEAALTLLEENIEYAFSVDVVPLLLHAANMNNTVIVRKLLEIGVDAYIESPDGITAMHNAANCPTTEMIDILVEAYPDIIHISQFNLDMGSPMHVAVKMKKMHNIEALLKHGVSPMFLYDKNGWTPIHAACEMGEFEIVKLLIDGPKEKPTPEVNRFILLRSPAKLAYYGYLPIHSAIVSGHANIARYLCEQGSPVLFPLNDYFNLYELALDFQDEKMMSLVMEFLNKEISDHFDKMQNKQELCDIDIIASIVIREKTATYQTNEEKMRDKQIDQFNKLNLEQRMNWYMHVKVTLDRAYQSQSFKSVEQQMLAFVACIEQEKPLPEQTQEIMQICKIIQMGCYLTLANIYCQKQDFRKGVYYANRILEIDKYHSQAYLIRSNCYQCLGEIRAAERDMAFYAQLAEEEALMQ
jgi:ankyrin repeat protein